MRTHTHDSYTTHTHHTVPIHPSIHPPQLQTPIKHHTIIARVKHSPLFFFDFFFDINASLSMLMHTSFIHIYFPNALRKRIALHQILPFTLSRIRDSDISLGSRFASYLPKTDHSQSRAEKTMSVSRPAMPCHAVVKAYTDTHSTHSPCLHSRPVYTPVQSTLPSNLYTPLHTYTIFYPILISILIPIQILLISTPLSPPLPSPPSHLNLK